MKKIIKIILFAVVGLAVLLGAVGAVFMYKIKNGFPVSFETDPPAIRFPADKPAVLLFSKSTGYRHSESIDASKKIFQEMAGRNGWFLHETEEGSVFNPGQLKQFKAVIINNSTGRVLNEAQQQAVAQYVSAGGLLMGIHGAGDFSHSDWPWLQTNLIGATFSHHPLKPQLQAADVHIEKDVDSALTSRLPASWTHTDEWYIYLSQPKDMQVIAYIDGDKIIPNGNMLFIKDKNFGMGKYQPVAWHRHVGQGKTFYTSMGHDAAVWQDKNFVNMLENAVRWSVR